MAKKTEPTLTGKKGIKQLVTKNLESLINKLDPSMGDKKMKRKIKKAGKILVKGIKPQKISETPKAKDPVPAS